MPGKAVDVVDQKRSPMAQGRTVLVEPGGAVKIKGPISVFSEPHIRMHICLGATRKSHNFSLKIIRCDIHVFRHFCYATLSFAYYGPLM